MPRLLNDLNDLPPLNLQVNIDSTPFERVSDAFTNIDIRLPTIVSNLNIFVNLMREAIGLSERFNTNLSAGAAAGVPTAFPVGNVQFPRSFEEDEGLIESSTLGREFLYGGDFPAFHRTFFGRSLLGLGGVGGLGLASQFLPDSATRALEISDLFNQLDIQFDTQALTEAVAVGIEEGFGRVISDTGAGERVETYGSLYGLATTPGVLPATTGLIEGGREVLERREVRGRLRLGRDLTGGARAIRDSFGQGVIRGTGLTAAIHAGYLSADDVAYARENDLGVFQSSVRRALPNAFGRDSFSDFSFYDLLPPGTEGILNLAGNFLYPPAEAGEIPAQLQPDQQGALGEARIQGPRRNLLPGLSITGDFDVSRYFNQGRGLLGDRFNRYVLGEGQSLSDVSSISDLRELLENSRLSRAGRELGDLSSQQLIQGAFAVSDDPGGFGRRVGQIENLQETVRRLTEVAGTDSELGGIFSDIDEDLTSILDKIDDFTFSSLNFFERLEVNAERANERFEGLENVADNVGLAFGNAFAQIAVEGRNLELVLSQLLQNIAQQLSEFLIVNPLQQFISGAVSVAGGALLGGFSGGGGGTVTGGGLGDLAGNFAGNFANSVIVNQNFAPGVQKSDLAPYSQLLKTDQAKEWRRDSVRPNSFVRTAIRGGLQ